MKYMFASDIHGSAYYCRKMLEAFEAEGAGRLFLLGDLLYHGPRNDLPKEYAPKQVIAMLNEKKQYLTNVRGNCDAEVDQMVLEFPVLADYGILIEGGHTFYMSHGHIYNEQNLPPLMDGDIFLVRPYPRPACREKRRTHLPEPGFCISAGKRAISRPMQSSRTAYLRSKA